MTGEHVAPSRRGRVKSKGPNPDLKYDFDGLAARLAKAPILSPAGTLTMRLDSSRRARNERVENLRQWIQIHRSRGPVFDDVFTDVLVSLFFCFFQPGRNGSRHRSSYKVVSQVEAHCLAHAGCRERLRDHRQL